MEVVIDDSFGQQRFLLPGGVVEEDLADEGADCQDGGFLGVETEGVYAVLAQKRGTGTGIS